MAFVPEDGTGLANANALASVAAVDAYWADRTDTVWTAGSSTNKEKAIVHATDFIERNFGRRFRGRLEFKDVQALSFPRLDLYDRQGRLLTGVPKVVIYAVAEYARRSLSGTDLQPDPTYGATGALIQEKTEQVGPILESTVYVEGAVQPIVRRWPAADTWLTEILAPAGSVIRG